jgi:hypothetical protein
MICLLHESVFRYMPYTGYTSKLVLVIIPPFVLLGSYDKGMISVDERGIRLAPFHAASLEYSYKKPPRICQICPLSVLKYLHSLNLGFTKENGLGSALGHPGVPVAL